jgi:ribosomal protein L16/L10AE
MKIVQSQHKSFKKTSKFLRAKANLTLETVIASQKNVNLSQNQLLALTHKLIRQFKSEKFSVLTRVNKNSSKKSLGSKLGSGKGKFSGSATKVRKFQNLLQFRSSHKLAKITTSLSKFSNLF